VAGTVEKGGKATHQVRPKPPQVCDGDGEDEGATASREGRQGQGVRGALARGRRRAINRLRDHYYCEGSRDGDEG